MLLRGVGLIMVGELPFKFPANAQLAKRDH
jgi:hypothetical protein